MYSCRLTVIFSQHFGNTVVSYNYFFFQVHDKFNCPPFTGDLSLGISGELLDALSSNMTSSLFHFLFRNSSMLNFFVVCVSQPLFYICIYIFFLSFCASVWLVFPNLYSRLFSFHLGLYIILFLSHTFNSV